MEGAARLPRWVWLIPLATAVAAVVAWTVWCSTEQGTWIGGVLVAASGLFVFAFVHESLERRGGLTDVVRRLAIAFALGLLATAATFLAAGIGYSLRCPLW